MSGDNPCIYTVFIYLPVIRVKPLRVHDMREVDQLDSRHAFGQKTSWHAAKHLPTIAPVLECEVLGVLLRDGCA